MIKFQELYIPQGVKIEIEFFNGYGKRELKQTIIGSVATTCVVAIFYAFTSNLSLSMVFILSGIAGSVMFTTKDQTNLSVLDQVKNIIKYEKSQKFYRYKISLDYDIENAEE